MRLPDEAKCHICKRIFCCGKCRQKHQFATHAIAVRQTLQPPHQAMAGAGAGVEAGGDAASLACPDSDTVYVFCPICEQKPLVLRPEMYAELLAHIESVHLPLRCRKCLRQYTKVDDLRDFTKCVDVAQNCSSSSSDTSKVTVKQAAVAMSTQTSPSIAKDMNETQHLTPISLINLRWKAKSRVTHEEFISDSVSSIRNLSSISNTSVRRSIGQLTAPPELVSGKGKLIRSTSTPLPLDTMFAKPKQPLTFNASQNASTAGGGYISSINHSGFMEAAEHNSPALPPALAAADNNNYVAAPPQRAWKMGSRHKMSAVTTPLRQVMSKSIQKAFVEHGGMLGPPATASQALQRRTRLDLSDNSCSEGNAGSTALDLRLSPVMRRTQSETSSNNYNNNSAAGSAEAQLSRLPYQQQILLSSQKLTTESIIITRMQLQSKNVSPALPTIEASGAESLTSATVYNSCESVEIITSTAELSAAAAVNLPPITPITRIPGAIINKKLIKFETPHKSETEQMADASTASEKDIFFTPNPGTPERREESGGSERRRQQIVRRQLHGQFSPGRQTQLPPERPRARLPLRQCNQHPSFSCVQDLNTPPESKQEQQSDHDHEDDDDEVFRPTSASTQNDKKRALATASSEQHGAGRLWSLMTSMMRLPATLRGERNDSSSSDKENNTVGKSGSLIKRCASIAGSLVRPRPDEVAMQSLKRKRTQTLDNQYVSSSYSYGHSASTSSQQDLASPSSLSKRYRIQPRKPIARMRQNT